MPKFITFFIAFLDYLFSWNRKDKGIIFLYIPFYFKNIKTHYKTILDINLFLFLQLNKFLLLLSSLSFLFFYLYLLYLSPGTIIKHECSIRYYLGKEIMKTKQKYFFIFYILKVYKFILKTNLIIFSILQR